MSAYIVKTDEDGKEVVVGHIHAPKMIERVKMRGIRRWCFGCRKRLVYERERFWQEWYGWTVQERCPTCKTDCSDFPGCGRAY